MSLRFYRRESGDPRRIPANQLTLLHGLETHQPPASGRLRGEEFKNAVAKLQEISGQPQDHFASELRPQTASPSRQITPDSNAEPPPPKITNTPLYRHEKEAARELADLYDDLIVAVSEMSPEAAQNIRKRPWMTPGLMKKCGVGWIPGTGRSLFRKTYLVYIHRNERGEVLSYGGFASRVNEHYAREFLNQYGLVVEGMNDVIRLEELRVAAVGITSNKATDTQIQTLVRFAQQDANNRITLFPDCDEEGKAGFKDLIWRLPEQQCKLRLACSSKLFNCKLAGVQPEYLTEDEW